MGWPKGKARVSDTPQVVEETKPIPRGTPTEIEKTPEKKETKVERKFSDETDHQGPYHPLCLGCNHREDMHHSWQSEQVLQDYRDGTGKVSQRLVTIKHKVFDAAKPCQHACKCTEYR